MPASGRIHPDANHFLLFGCVLLAGLVSLPQELKAGSVTALGIASAFICCAAWLLWLTSPYLPRRHLGMLLPLLLFAVYATGSILWFNATVKGLQLLCVLLGFVALIMLTMREVERDPSLAGKLHRAIGISTWFATILYAISLVQGGLGSERILLARPYALFVLIGLAQQLAIWQSGRRSGLLGAAIILAVLLGSVSRTALGAALLMFPLAAIVRGGRRGFGIAVASAVFGCLVLGGALLYSETIYERFFGLDSTIQVGGVWVNGSGRTAMWSRLWESAIHEPLFGQGLGSSSLLIDRYFPGLGHPHNDFLRFFYDFGLVGLCLWLAFHGTALAAMFTRARESRRTGTTTQWELHLVPFLGLVALGLGMLTDNSVSYLFVMSPLAVMLGCSLGQTRERTTGLPCEGLRVERDRGRKQVLGNRSIASGSPATSWKPLGRPSAHPQ